MLRQYSCVIGALTLLSVFPASAYALDCPKQPEQVSKDWQLEVDAAVAKIGPIRGGDLKTQTKSTTQDLLGKLPNAEKIYLEQMMFAAYCSALRDDKTTSEVRKAQLLREYSAEVRNVIEQQPRSSSPAAKGRAKPVGGATASLAPGAFAIAPGHYRVVDASGLDEAFSNAVLDVTAHVITLRMEALSGNYKYSIRYIGDGPTLKGEIISSDEPKYLGLQVHGSVSEQGPLFSMTVNIIEARKIIQLTCDRRSTSQ
jgi:hypothetical protein